MLLQDMIDKDLVEIKKDQPKNWQEALYEAAEKLIENNFIKKEYVDEIIKNVNINGPYIVIIPGVAMPHAMAESENVLGTAIGFTKFNKPVVFDEKDQNMKAQLFFTLAAKNYDAHLKNISELSEILSKDELVDELLKIKNIKDFKEIVNKYK